MSDHLWSAIFSVIVCYEHVNITSFTVSDVTLWLEDNHPLLYSFKFIQSELKIDTKCCHPLAITLFFQLSKPENFCIFAISNAKSFISQNLKVVGPLRGKFDFFSLLGFEIQYDFDHKILNLKLCCARALKHYLNEKNLIHRRVPATISKVST